MSNDPILLIGGAGHVGRWTARSLRAAHPDLPLLIGGRDRARAERAAADLHAEAVVIDDTVADLGLGHRRVSAIATLFTDQRLTALQLAQTRGVPHLSISPGIIELGPEVAAYMHRPQAAPVVLGTEWMVGGTTVPTLAFAKAFGRIDDISIGALLDEQDAFGPAAEADLERQTRTMPLALVRQDGAYVWRAGDDLKTSFRAVDGTVMAASAFSPNDVLGLATATGAPNVRFSLAVGVSSSRRRGEPLSTEIIIELTGMDHAGRPLRRRHAIIHPGGQMPLTGLGVALVLERLIGLDGRPATPAGLYFPYQLIGPDTYFTRLAKAGGEVMELEAA
ncbi:NAD(P)-dependent oxidoreductase [Rhodopseudomonas palustris]|uniref:NAD(P)-dependent oxidoreductase n=1 Tax=Rhodopseudomonas palustris TaxID=1076 RepID=UPI0020CD7EAF|nr:NAD(P)-dependent oxidoreductase [Rhodopseudomonas palustris]MCP9625864.1 NAD(P)-dependent oxidoreductase [Rhodopseudomonas palustris]